MANVDDGTLTKVDVQSRRAVQTIELTSSPIGIAFADGSVWPTAVATPVSHRGGVLRVALSGLSDCECLDPKVSWDNGAWQLMANVYDGLVGYKRVAGALGRSLVPDLARTVPTPTDGGKTYSFQLRPGVRFSNGRVVRASDVLYSFERLYTAGYRYNQIPYYGGIVGAEACAGDPSSCDLSGGIEADDTTGTVTIHLTQPDGDFLYKLALPFAAIVSAESPPAKDSGLNVAGTGPYKLAQYDGNGVRLVRNPHFQPWSLQAQPAGYPDEITAILGLSPDEQLSAVMNGKADYTSELPPERIADLSTRYPGQFHSDSMTGVYFVSLNSAEAPFDDVRARQALNYAVDRRRVVELMGGPAMSQITCQFLPPNFPGYEPHCPYTFDPNPAGTWTAPDIARARRLVSASGTKGMRVEMFVKQDWAKVGRYLASVLDEIGYDGSLTVFTDDERYFDAIYAKHRYQAAMSGWVGDTGPANFLQVNFGCPAAENTSKFCDPRISALIDRAVDAQSAENAVSLAPWAEADRALTTVAPVVPLFNPRRTVLLSTRTGNFQSHPEYGALLDQLWVR
ncbi:MAG TPA: ABC transporter substrate-binding protein [Gaiellaceae bacterium]|nr:ABC transporter substrate-binding protein [Gaiellaceae bacterium]